MAQKYPPLLDLPSASVPEACHGMSVRSLNAVDRKPNGDVVEESGGAFRNTVGEYNEYLADACEPSTG
jgi:hypothetical protein